MFSWAKMRIENKYVRILFVMRNGNITTSWHFMRIQKSLHRFEAFLRLRFYYSNSKKKNYKGEISVLQISPPVWSSAVTHYVHTYDGLGCHSWNYFLKKQSWSHLSLWSSPHTVQDLNSDNSRRDKKSLRLPQNLPKSYLKLRR